MDKKYVPHRRIFYISFYLIVFVVLEKMTK